MPACPASNQTKLCPQRHTCELHRRYLEAGSGPVSLVSMPVSAGDGCYMYRPIEVKTV